MTPLKKLCEKDTVRHIWGCVLRAHPHICRTGFSTLAFFSGLNYNITCVVSSKGKVIYMKRAMNVVMGFAIGGVISAGIVLLLTPASGEKLRAQLQTRVRTIQQEIQGAAAARRAELEEQLAVLRRQQKNQIR